MNLTFTSIYPRVIIARAWVQTFDTPGPDDDLGGNMFDIDGRISRTVVRMTRRKRKNDEKKYNALAIKKTVDLERGDILIVKDFGGAGEDPDSDYIRAGQALFSRMGKSGSATSEHAILVAEDHKANVFESAGSGVVSRSAVSSRPHLLYRYTGDRHNEVATEAVRVARYLCNGHSRESLSQIGGTPDPSVDYASGGKMAASVFRSKHKGVFANRRIKSIHDAYLSGRDVRSLSLGMICSEFVATCYEVAAMVWGANSPMNADPRALTAKALQSVLNRRSFDLVGSYRGDVSHSLHQLLLSASFLGPLLKIADAEIAAGNELERAPDEATVNLGDGDKVYGLIDFTDKFQIASVTGLPFGVHKVEQGSDVYIYTQAPGALATRGIERLAICAPKF